MRWAGEFRTRAIAVVLAGLEVATRFSDRLGPTPTTNTSLREDELLVLWDSISSSVRLRKVAPLPTIPMADFPSNGAARVGAQIEPLGYSFGTGASAALPARSLPSDFNANLLQNRP